MEKGNEIMEDIKNYEPRLNQEWVQILINLRMKYAKSFTRKRNSAAEAWKNILQEMMDLGAPPYVTLDKIKKKWMNLIARYKHLKFAGNSEAITWPYFEQIDRAYSRNPYIVETRSKCKKGSESDESYVSDYAEYMMKKQKFTSILIHLRYAYRHLFTGKKYAAQKGWMMIQNLLPGGQNYSIEQISKCWQNLIQRYKSILETEKDLCKITWVHFNNMHEIMTKKDDAVLTDLPDQIVKKEICVSPMQSMSIIENENNEVILKNESDFDENVISNCLEIKMRSGVGGGGGGRRKKSKNATLNELLNHLKEQDKKIERNHKEILDSLNSMQKIISDN
ncbi:PREDICTED: uncharacterized protein LOC108563448 [Nicrophorus vespilloides]|uniref:Uncharacterized protein LOC108563448 n=1 Tax=Nicrophorus vespilloides TaxID=110193 RepID=A0ABM1MSR2_NICVS|nr:PREDICTED: uncharacterized protein LOC108563448 [Nicrophorus vespilloides]